MLQRYTGCELVKQFFANKMSIYKWRLLGVSFVLASFIACYTLMTSSVTILHPAMFSTGRCGDVESTLRDTLLPVQDCPCSNGQENASDLDEGNVQHVVQNSSTNESTSAQKQSSHQILLGNGKTIMNSSLTRSLWDFKELGDQQLFLYGRLLNAEWKPNHTNIDKIRNELAGFRADLGGSSNLIMHQQNTKLKESLTCVFDRKPRVVNAELYNRLPKKDPFPGEKLFQSCAVVGNSGSLLGSQCGGAIDQHDYVFRCNLAPLEPFKESAGLKSDLTTMNPSITWTRYGGLKKAAQTKKFNQDLSEYNGLLWVPCFQFSGMFPAAYNAMKAYKGTNPRLVCGYPNHFKAVVDFWAMRGMNKRISTGFFLATAALQMCERVELYGFWPFPVAYSPDGMSHVPYHYFDNISQQAASVTHSMDAEFNVLVQLHVLGVLRINHGTCS